MLRRSLGFFHVSFDFVCTQVLEHVSRRKRHNKAALMATLHADQRLNMSQPHLFAFVTNAES